MRICMGIYPHVLTRRNDLAVANRIYVPNLAGQSHHAAIPEPRRLQPGIYGCGVCVGHPVSVRTVILTYTSERPRRRRFVYTLVVLTLFTVPNVPTFRDGLAG